MPACQPPRSSFCRSGCKSKKLTAVHSAVRLPLGIDSTVGKDVFVKVSRHPHLIHSIASSHMLCAQPVSLKHGPAYLIAAL